MTLGIGSPSNQAQKKGNDVGNSVVCSALFDCSAVRHQTGGRLYQDSNFGWVTISTNACV